MGREGRAQAGHGQMIQSGFGQLLGKGLFRSWEGKKSEVKIVERQRRLGRETEIMGKR